jgi:hypothetical protein
LVRSHVGMRDQNILKPSSNEGYDLIGKVALETKLPTDDIIPFIIELIKTEDIDPKTLSLEQLREAVINYLARFN